MKRIKLLPLIISFSLVHSTLAADLYGISASSYLGSGFDDGVNVSAFTDVGGFTPIGPAVYGVSLADEGVSVGQVNFDNSLHYGGVYGQQSKMIGYVEPADYGSESFASGKNENWYMTSSEDSYNCNKSYVPFAAVRLAETFSDGTCQNTSNNKAEYCGCIKGRVSTLGLAEKYKDHDTRELVKDNIDKIKNAYLFDLTNNAVFSYVAMSEKVGYGMLSSVDAHVDIINMQKKSKAPLCIPGNLKRLIKDLKKDNGDPCFSDQDKSDMAGVFKTAFKERQKEFPNISYNDELMKKAGFDSLILQTDIHLNESFKNGLRSVSNFQINEEFLKKPIKDMVMSPALIGNDILPNRALALQNAFVIGEQQSTGELSILKSIDSRSYMHDLSQIEEVYLKDPIMREQFYSYMYSYGQNKQVSEEEKLGYSFLNKDYGLQYFDKDTSGFYNFEKVFEQRHKANMKRVALENIARNMYDRAKEESGDKELSAEKFSEEMAEIRNKAIIASANHCNQAFEKVKRACNMTAEEILKDTVDNPKKVQHIVNRMVNYENTKDKKVQDDYIEKHVKAGAIACVEWSEIGGTEKSKSQVFEAANNMEDSHFDGDGIEAGEGVRVAVGDEIESGSVVEGTEGIADGSDVLEASADEYSRVTGFNNNNSSTASAFKNPLASSVGNFTTSNFDNFRNIASVGSNEDASASQSDQASNDDSSDPQVNSLIDGYNAKIANMQKKLDEMSKKLEEADKKKQADEMAKLNEAISKATATITKLQSDKKKLVDQLASGPTRPAQNAQGSDSANVPRPVADIGADLQQGTAGSAGTSPSVKPEGLSATSSYTSRRNSAGVLVDANGMTSDDYLYQLREGSMQGQTGTVLTLTSLKDPSIGDQVKTAFKSGDRVIYANVNGSVYRIIPQVDSNGDIIEKGGEVVYVTEIVGGEIDNELKEMQDGKVKEVIASKEKKKDRKPASIPAGMIQQGNSDDVKFGYDAMMDLTEEALEK